jgi:hypothetical protein
MKKLVGEGKPFHSAVDKTAALLKRKAGTGAEFMKELMGVSGVKPTELQERGLTEIMGMPRMTYDQFMANLATRPAPAIGEKVLGGEPEPPSKEAVRRQANRAIAARSREYASEASDTSSEYRSLLAEEIRRLRSPNHMPNILRIAREDLTELPDYGYHSKWTLPGGENYREMLIKMPAKYWAQRRGEEKVVFDDPDEASKHAGSSGQAALVEGQQYFPGVGAHFNHEPNILASMRVKDRLVPDLEGPHNVTIIGGGGVSNKKFNTREEANAFADVKKQGGYKTKITPLNNKKYLHLEELQSDWHQKGREKGYKDLDVDNQLQKKYRELNEIGESYKKLAIDQRVATAVANGMDEAEARRLILIGTENTPLEQYAPDEKSKIDILRRQQEPDAPFKKNWEEMALKRLIHHAAEKGYHGVVVTPGAEQADRYSIGKAH